MNCTRCSWPRIALCAEAKCVPVSSAHAIAAALAVGALAHSAYWWRRATCRAASDAQLAIPNQGVVLLYVLVHVLAALGMVLLVRAAVVSDRFESEATYQTTTDEWILVAGSRWSCAIVFDLCCEARRREQVGTQ